jgi:predicted TIM-barrel fold metal-dependent hydrolase
VIYKNMNVWADLSGLLVGSDDDLTDEASQQGRRDVIERIRTAFRYAERPNRFLYGSDWPLAPMTVYSQFVRDAVPADFHEMVFQTNAQTLLGERFR